MRPHGIHYWFHTSLPGNPSLIQQIQVAARLCGAQCRVTPAGKLTSVYIVTSIDHLDTLSVFGTPVYVGPI